MPTILLRRWHVCILFAICGLVNLVYAPINNAYFCGFDDYFELHRATFEDTQTPDHILTTSHRNSNKYRPLYRLANDVTYWWGGGSPTPFHLRNLLFHCLMVGSVYWLGLIFFSWPVAASSALLFGLHPMVHQSVAVATFYNAAPNMQFLLTFVLLLVGYLSQRTFTRWLSIGLGLLVGALALFTYEPALTSFGFIYLYFLIDYFVTGKRPTWRFLAILTFGIILAAGSYFLARAIFVPETFSRSTGGIAPPGKALLNLVMYFGALFMPVDLVLAHDWLGTLLPRDIQLTPAFLAALGTAAIAICLVFRRWIREHLPGLPTTPMIFLAIATPSSLILFLVFTDHASETYLPVPTAMFSLAFCAVFWQFCRRQPVIFATTVGVLALFSALACLNRNTRLISCSDAASAILTQLPPSLRRGPAIVLLSPTPGEEASYAYGIYGYKGIDTIGPEEVHVRNALQTFFRNEQLDVRLVTPGQLMAAARAPLAGHLYYFVHADGSLSPPSLSMLLH